MQESKKISLSTIDVYNELHTIFSEFRQGSTSVKDLQSVMFTSFGSTNALLLKQNFLSIKKITILSGIRYEVLNILSQMEPIQELEIDVNDQLYNQLYNEEKFIGYLSKFVRLKKLYLFYYKKDTQLIRNIPLKLPHLQQFGISYYPNPQQIVKLVDDLRGVSQLHFYSCTTSGDLLKNMEGCLPRLTNINLCGVGLNDDKLKIVTDSLKNIVVLDISQNMITDKGIRYIEVYQKTLKNLNIVQNQITCYSIELIGRILQGLECFKGDTIIITYDSLPIFLERSSRLTKFHLSTHYSDWNNISNFRKGVEQFAKSKQSLKQLKLVENNSKAISLYDNHVLQTISQSMKELRKLYLHGERLNNAGCFYISKIASLRRFQNHYQSRCHVNIIGLLKMTRNNKCCVFIIGNTFNISKKLLRNIKVLNSATFVSLKDFVDNAN